MTSTSSPRSLLSNVSFHEEVDDLNGGSPTHSNDLNSVNSAKELQRRQNRPNSRTGTPDRTRSGGSIMSNSYQKLLDRSNDLESPLKLFAQKHGFQLAEKPESVAGSSDHSASVSPVDTETSTDLTKVSPRSESEGLPYFHVSDENRNGTPVGQSYVISTALTSDRALAAGIPIIEDHLVSDSVTDVTFTSMAPDSELNGELANNELNERSDSPIEPIVLSDRHNAGDGERMLSRDSPVTSFVSLGMSKRPPLEQSTDVSCSSPSTGLKQRFEQHKGASSDGRRA